MDRGKKWPIADRRVPWNDPRNDHGTHFGSRSLVVSNVANSLHVLFYFSCVVQAQRSQVRFKIKSTRCLITNPSMLFAFAFDVNKLKDRHTPSLQCTRFLRERQYLCSRNIKLSREVETSQRNGKKTPTPRVDICTLPNFPK